MIEFANPPEVHPPVASYSHHVKVENCTLTMTSGQIGMREDGTVPQDSIEQLEVAFENVRANVEASGMTMSDVIKLTIFLVGDLDTERRRDAIARHLGDHRPTMSVLYVAGLGSDSMKVEIEAVAAAPASA